MLKMYNCARLLWPKTTVQNTAKKFEAYIMRQDVEKVLHVANYFYCIVLGVDVTRGKKMPRLGILCKMLKYKLMIFKA